MWACVSGRKRAVFPLRSPAGARQKSGRSARAAAPRARTRINGAGRPVGRPDAAGVLGIRVSGRNARRAHACRGREYVNRPGRPPTGDSAPAPAAPWRPQRAPPRAQYCTHTFPLFVSVSRADTHNTHVRTQASKHTHAHARTRTHIRAGRSRGGPAGRADARARAHTHTHTHTHTGLPDGLTRPTTRSFCTIQHVTSALERESWGGGGSEKEREKERERASEDTGSSQPRARGHTVRSPDTTVTGVTNSP